ncbi:MAG: DUF3224 domain-containing protein [Terrimesophilobacter sp.]
MSIASGAFEIVTTPGRAEFGGAVDRLDFTRTFRGDLDATGTGLILSAGNPQAGEAGYIAIELVRGRLGGFAGDFALQQFGTMHGGTHTVRYDIMPGTGHGALAGISGTLNLTVEADGSQRYELNYEL